MREILFGCGSSELTRREVLICALFGIAINALIFGFFPLVKLILDLRGVAY